MQLPKQDPVEKTCLLPGSLDWQNPPDSFICSCVVIFDPIRYVWNIASPNTDHENNKIYTINAKDAGLLFIAKIAGEAE
ncbi:hypothetical protein BB559_004806, partial [Furculomyces boomerangus]